MYNASKAAVNLLSDNLRIELAPFGVQVITVSDRKLTTSLTKDLTILRSLLVSCEQNFSTTFLPPSFPRVRIQLPCLSLCAYQPQYRLCILANQRQG